MPVSPREQQAFIRARRVFELLLALYPRDFRQAYGNEMRYVFAQSYRSTGSGPSAAGRLRFWLRTAHDTLMNAMGFRLDVRRASRRAARSKATGSNHPWNGLREFIDGAKIMARRPGFALLCAAVLGAAGAAVITVGAVANSTLVRPFPYRDAGDVVLGWGSNATSGQLRDVISGPVALELARQNTTLEALAAFKPDGAVLMHENRPHVLDNLTVTTDFFRVLGIEPWLGRWFKDEERYSGRELVAVVSHNFWREAMGGDSAAVGTRLELNGTPHTVVGVLPPEFYFPHADPDVITPLHEDVLAGYGRTSYDYWLVGRLDAHASVQSATQDLNAILAGIAREDPRLEKWSILVEPLQQSVVQYARPAILALVAAVAFVWLVAVVNVTNLLLIRHSGRQGSLAIRRALGASTARIALLLLGENTAIAIAGFAAAVSASALALQITWKLIPSVIPIPGSAAQITLAQPTLDGTVLFLAAALFAVGLAAFSVPIIWKGSRVGGAGLHINTRNQSPTRRTLRVHHALVTTELALATLLLIGAGLAVRTTANLLRVDPGLQPDGLLSMYVGDLDDRSPLDRVRFFDGIVREIAALPGVRAVGLNDYVPLQNEDDFEGVRFPERPAPLPGQGPREEWRRVSADYFAAAGIALLSGRAFTTQDDHQRPSVAVVNRAFAARYYEGSDPVGERIFLTNQEYGLTQIVGVVDNVLRRGLDQASPPVVYVPYPRRPRPNMAVFVRAEGDPRSIVMAVQQAIWRVDPEQPIDRINVVTDVVNASIGIPRLVMQVVGALAGLAVVLSAIGVFGVTAYAVRLRRHEIGIRVALGATPGRIRSQIVTRGVIVAGAGVILGSGAAAMLGNGVRTVLFGVTPTDPLTISTVGSLLVLVSVAATYVPARRASRLDPVESIRAE